MHGAINMLGLAKRVKAKILQASTSEVYGDPDVHPQPETYWGRVNPIGPRSCYDEGKRCAETLFFDRLAPRKPRPLGRGQGELYKNAYLPYREAPPFKAGSFTIIVSTI